MNTSLDTIFKTLCNRPILQQRSASWNNNSLLSPLLNLLKSKKTVFEKISKNNRSLLNQNDSIIVETLLFGSNGLNGEKNAWTIELTIEYYNHGKAHNTIVMNPFKQITTFLEISNWFWITLCHNFQLLGCSIYI